DFNIPLRHVTAGTIITRVLLVTQRKRYSAALFRMAGKALTAEISGRLGIRSLDMWIMTGEAAEATFTLLIALAKRHQEIVLEKISLQRIIAAWWNHKHG